jgi:hypothetical protein
MRPLLALSTEIGARAGLRTDLVGAEDREDVLRPGFSTEPLGPEKEAR